MADAKKVLEEKKKSMVNPFASMVDRVTDIDGARIVKYKNGKNFTIHLFAGRDTAKMLAKVTKYGSSMFGGMIRGLADSEEDVDHIAILIACSLRESFMDVDDPQFLYFLTDELMLKVTHTDSGQAFDWDKEFIGKNMIVCFDLIKQVIAYNFSPVFQELGISALLNQKEKISKD
jgi:hypothetical protein